ncbi:MAG TPA: HAMP domain-containing histidine kinase [Rhodospirillaceae bacterium]|nr:HAMP domain-containing histidine kinase [Rhodospirillaceae bacterium]
MTFSPRKERPASDGRTSRATRQTAERDAAIAANEAKTRLLATASHDLRQPLQALGLFVAALEKKRLPRDAREILRRIDSCVESIDHLLRNLLDIARLDAGGIEVQPVSFPVRQLFDRLAIEFEALAAAKGLSIRFIPTAARVYSDPVLLERMLRNLLANAIRFTERGGVVVGARRRGNKIRIEVWDSGRGIDEAQKSEIFREFHQLAESEAGQGLGLAIVDRLARLLGSRIDLQSRPGKGSMFAIVVKSGAPG